VCSLEGRARAEESTDPGTLFGGGEMPLPDPNANEPTRELDRDKWKLYQEARAAIKAWTTEMVRLRKELEREIGDAYAGTVDGDKVVTYRYKDQWAVTTLVKDNPDLAEHFYKYKTERVFDLDEFRARHPDIAEKYRVRAFVEGGGM
jgi:hypothetical protein